MRLLLDTHVLLWALANPERLDRETRSVIEHPANDVLFSSASIWEIVIKSGLGREDFKVDAIRLRRLLVANGYEELPITADHALAVDRLPRLHRDPFDRILIAQARADKLGLVTTDALVSQYGEGILAV